MRICLTRMMGSREGGALLTRDTYSSSTSLDFSTESRLPFSPSSSDCTLLSVDFFSEDGVLFSTVCDVEVTLAFCGVGWGDWLSVVGEGCWLGEAGLPLLCASVCCLGIRDRMISATVSRISSRVRTFHSCLSLTLMNMTSTGLFMSGVLFRLSGGGLPSRTWREHVLPLPAMPYMTTLSTTSSKCPRFISCS